MQKLGVRILRIILSSFVSVIIFAIILIGCGASELEPIADESGLSESESLTTESGLNEFESPTTEDGLNESELPTTETRFPPIGFTRISDGAHIRLGMSRDDVGKILESWNIFTEEPMESSGPIVSYYDYITIFYFGDTVARIGAAVSEEWATVGGFSVGDNIQSVFDSVFDSNRLLRFTHNDEDRNVVIDAHLDNAPFRIVFFYNEDGFIRSILLMAAISDEMIFGDIILGVDWD